MQRITLLVRLSLLALLTYPAFGAQKHKCIAFSEMLHYSASQAIVIFLSVPRVQDEGLPPVAQTGRVRVLEGSQLIVQTTYQLNFEQRLFRFTIPASTGWHVYTVEYVDPTGRISQCSDTISPIFVGTPTPPTVYQYPQDGNIYYSEPRYLLLMASPDLTSGNENARLFTLDADSNQILWQEHKEHTWVQGMPPTIVHPLNQIVRLNLRLELRNIFSGSTVFRDPNIYRFNWIPASRPSLTTVTTINNFTEGETFELQARIATGFNANRLFGRLDWFDGDERIATQALPGTNRADEPFFLPRTNESPGLHRYRAEFIASAPPPGRDGVPGGRSAIYEVLVTAPTTMSLTSDVSPQPGLNSGVRLRATVVTSRGPVPSGVVTFHRGSSELGRASVLNGSAQLDLPNFPSGSSLIEARFLPPTGYLASSTTATVQYHPLIVMLPVAVRNAASGTAALAAGALATIYGENLASTTLSATTTPLPTSLGGITLQIIGANSSPLVAAPLLYISPTQINFLLPDTLAPGLALLTILQAGRPINQLRLQISPSAPGIFTVVGTIPAGFLIIRDREGRVRSESLFACVFAGCTLRPVLLTANDSQAVLVLFGTGWRGASSSLTAVLGNGTNLQTIYAGQQGEFAGLDQVNLEWPLTLKGRQRLLLRTGSGVSNTIEVFVE